MGAVTNEISKIREEFAAYDGRLDDKVNSEEAKRLWGNFKGYALYQDLKDLYTKCVP